MSETISVAFSFRRIGNDDDDDEFLLWIVLFDMEVECTVRDLKRNPAAEGIPNLYFEQKDPRCLN